MSQLHLNAIVTQALLDDDFRAGILNGQRCARLAAFDLTEQEREAVLAIPAHDLDGFIRQVEQFTHYYNIWPEQTSVSQTAPLWVGDLSYSG
jgi:hypothetical protein